MPEKSYKPVNIPRVAHCAVYALCFCCLAFPFLVLYAV